MTRKITTALVGMGLALGLAGAASAQGQPQAEALIPLVRDIIAAGRDDGLSEDEIRNRSLRRGAETAFDNRDAGAVGALQGFNAYRQEKRRLEDQERRRREARQRRIIEGVGRLLLSPQ